MFRTRCTTGGRGRARSCAAVVAGATLLASTAAGVVGTAAVAGAAPVTSGAAPVTLTVPTAHGHGARHGAVPRWTRDVGGVDALGHMTTPAAAARRSASSSTKLVTYGGGLTVAGPDPLVAAGVTTGQPKVYLVFMGDQWGDESTNGAGQDVFSQDPDGLAPALQTLYAGMGTDSETWSGVLTQYCDGAPVGATSCLQGDSMIPYPSPGVLAGVWYDSSPASSAQESAGLTEQQIALEAEAATTYFGNTDQASNRDAQYVIVSPTGTDPDGWNNPVNGYCAYHDDTHDPSIGGGGPVTGPIVAFTNLPYVPDVGPYCGAGTVNSPGTLDGATEAASHEFAETVTDQFPETNPVPGWINSAGSEIGDLCAYVATGPGQMFDLTMATGVVAVQGLWSNRADGGRGACEDGEPDFTFTSSVTSVSPAKGPAGSTVTITGKNLAGATAVFFAGTAAQVVTDAATSITAIVPAGAADGVLSVTSSSGTAVSPKVFHLTPTIASFGPISAARGESVTVTGSGLGSVKKVVVGGKRATVTTSTASQIEVVVPAKASTGPIVVTTPYGVASSATTLTVS